MKVFLEVINNSTIDVKFEKYDQRLVYLIKSLPDRRYSDFTKTWRVKYGLKKLVELLEDNDAEVEITDFRRPLSDFDSLVEPYEDKLFSHQIENVKFGLANKNFLLLDEQGLGKTCSVLTLGKIASEIENIPHILIICGVNSLRTNWVAETERHLGEKAYILGTRISKKGNVSYKGDKEKREDIEKLLTDPASIDAFVLIVNVEFCRDEKNINLINDLTARRLISMVAIDEAHKIKNPYSQQAKGLMKIRALRKVVMTGTPIMNSPLDLYPLLSWTEVITKKYKDYKEYFCEMGGYQNHQILGYKHMEDLNDYLSNNSIRHTKEAVLDLPEKLYVDEHLEMSTRQQKIYDAVLKELCTDIDKIESIPNPLAQLTRLRQATASAELLSTEINDSTKIDRMVEIVRETVENGKKIVIFSIWSDVAELAYRALESEFADDEKYGYLFEGAVDIDSREKIVNEFQNDPDCAFICGTIKTLGTGLTLTAATTEVFLDIPWTSAELQQAEDRCHRIGTTEPITIYRLMCAGTIDERIQRIVEGKALVASALVDGKVTTESQKTLVKFLLGLDVDITNNQ